MSHKVANCFISDSKTFKNKIDLRNVCIIFIAKINLAEYILTSKRFFMSVQNCLNLNN